MTVQRVLRHSKVQVTRERYIPVNAILRCATRSWIMRWRNLMRRLRNWTRIGTLCSKFAVRFTE